MPSLWSDAEIHAINLSNAINGAQGHSLTINRAPRVFFEYHGVTIWHATEYTAQPTREFYSINHFDTYAETPIERPVAHSGLFHIDELTPTGDSHEATIRAAIDNGQLLQLILDHRRDLVYVPQTTYRCPDCGARMAAIPGNYCSACGTSWA